MIVRSLRLKNIKSYGEGVNGEGITVEFAAGTNRIAGRNGHGKSTLIESLGYALFLTPPLFEENVQVATYLLRAGQKAGEIDVTFEHDREVYRVERGLGLRNTRRSKVVQLSDNSIAAEGDHEVSAFLCRLLGCLTPERLSELFAKLVGVKQGRLAWPFDSKPTEARKHFEPLLDVEIFRQCFDRLKPVVDEFTETSRNESERLAGVTERVRDRADAPERVNARRTRAEALGKALELARTALKTAGDEKLRWEVLEKSWTALRDSHERARSDAQLAENNRKHAEQSHAEAMRAAAAVAESEADYNAYLASEKTLSLLQQRQDEKSRLEKERATTNAQRVGCEAKAVAAREAADDREKRRSECEQRGSTFAREAQAISHSLAGSKGAFEAEAKTIQQMREDEETVRHWIRGLPQKTKRVSELATTIENTRQLITGWNSAAFAAARTNEQSFWQELTDLSGRLAAAGEMNASLKRQLEQISEGVCPFLKDRCNQFDPAKVAGDLQTSEAGLAALNSRVIELRENHRTAKSEFERLNAEEAKLAHWRMDLERREGELVNESRLLIPPEILGCGERLGLNLSGFPGDLNGSIPAWLAGVQEFSDSSGKAFAELVSQLKGRSESFEEKRKRRLLDEHQLSQHQQNSALLAKEALALAEEVAARIKEAANLRAEAEAAAKSVEELDRTLQAYASLDQQISAEQQRKTSHAAAYQRFLAAKPLADELSRRQQLVDERKMAEAAANQNFERLSHQLQTAAGAFNPGALENARKIYGERMVETGAAELTLRHAKEELQREESRLRELEKSQTEKSRIELEISRVQAAIDLTEKARSILKNAAPHVAHHLCRRIASRAQLIFNQINHEPVELEWNSERYSLRIHPGERRFAMLSGGEQTKLALAMTLAMIQEFCGLKFCVFDEPTYGVDGDSRLKLADAILVAQEAAGFDQLLLVSHDDAFDGKIEHTVRLDKSAAGTRPVAE